MTWSAIRTWSPNMIRGHAWRRRKPHNGQPKLTEQQVREIIHALQTHRATQRELAFMYRVSQPTIWRIWHKKSWKHVWDSIIIR